MNDSKDWAKMKSKERELRTTWENHFLAEVRKSKDLFEWGDANVERDLRWAAENWAMAGFDSKNEASRHYNDHYTACRIRTYFRRNRITTRKGSKHAFDCRREHFQLWNIVRRGDIDTKADGIRWSYRTVDGLKNLYVFFEERKS